MAEQQRESEPGGSRKRGLGRDAILGAAIAIADENGIDGLSMRRVADRLGHGVMSLYRHVEDKERLIALISDAVFAEEAYPDVLPAGWRERLRESAVRQWRCYGRHPWIASTVSLSRPRLGPHGMREMEWALAGMHELSVPDAEKVRMYLVVTAYVHGAASQLAEEQREQERSGLETTSWWSEQGAALRELFASGQFPVLARLRPGVEPSPAVWFEFGLECLLDGLARQVVRQG